MGERSLYVCHGDYTIFIPRLSSLTEKLDKKVHCETLLEGVGLTMTKTKSLFCFPKLRQLTKTIIHRCFGCKNQDRYHFVDQLLGNYPKTEQKVTDHYKWQELISLDQSHKRSRKRKLQFRGSLILAVHHAGEVNLNR